MEVERTMSTHLGFKRQVLQPLYGEDVSTLFDWLDQHPEEFNTDGMVLATLSSLHFIITRAQGQESGYRIAIDTSHPDSNIADPLQRQTFQAVQDLAQARR